MADNLSFADKVKQLTTKAEKPAQKGVAGAEAYKAAAGTPANPRQVPAGHAGEFGRDSRPYSYLAVMKAMQTRDWSHAKEELGVHEDLRRAGYAPPVEGILAPLDPAGVEEFCPQLKGLAEKCAMPAATKDALNSPAHMRQVAKALGAWGDDTAGGALQMPVLANTVIDLLRPRVITERAGAQVIPLPPSGQLSWARTTADPTFSWLGENTAGTATDPTLGNIIFTSKLAMGLVEVSNESIRFSSPSVEALVRNVLAKRGAVFMDAAYIQGIGSGYRPPGIIDGHANVQSHTASTTGVNGDTFEASDVNLMIGKVLAGNADMPTAFLMHPTIWAGIGNRRADSVTAADGKGPFLFQWTAGIAEQGIPDRLRNVPVYYSTSVPSNRVKSGGTTLTAIVCGDFNYAVIARSGVLELAADSGGTYFAKNQTAMRAIFRTDFALTQERAFVVADQLLNQ